MTRLPVILAALAAASFAPVAHAAPPPNDNRADAQRIDAFPAQIHGTLAEATTERLDPQVSECGPIASTVWYRVDTAPDGTIGFALKAASAGTAPVLRIYARGGSAIREVACNAVDRGGTASVSFETTRGANYFVLVGRRPASSDGEFDLHGDLRLPPEPPRNDKLATATRIAQLPAKVAGTTVGARADANDPEGCEIAGGTVWYRLPAARDGVILVDLHANGKLDAAVAVLARARSRVEHGPCRATDVHGNAVLAFGARRGITYFLVVGRQEESGDGAFTLTARGSAPPEQAPGRALSQHAVHASLNGLTNVNDVWHTDLAPGTTYRISFASRDACTTMGLRRAGEKAILLTLECAGYRTFTPGPDGGGRYILEVEAAPRDVAQPYRLQLAAAQADDVGIGRPIVNHTTQRGTLAPTGVDVVDVYHFDVLKRADVSLSLRRPGDTEFTMQLVTAGGSRIGSDVKTLRRTLEPGTYVVAVAGRPGTRDGAYRLSLLVRDITTTTLALPAKSVRLYSALALRAVVAPAASGAVEIQIDRFDPLGGWQFTRLIRTTAGASVTWLPPAEGLWRVRATYRGSDTASPSRSEYVHVTVT